MCTMLFAAKLVCVQFMYSTSLEGQARPGSSSCLKNGKTNNNESQTHGLKAKNGQSQFITFHQKPERQCVTLIHKIRHNSAQKFNYGGLVTFFCFLGSMTLFKHKNKCL